jgi:hypothetical protein
LTFGVPLLLAVRELVVLRRGSSGGGFGDWRDAPPRPPMPPQLPPCLLVPPRITQTKEPAARGRVLDHV